MLVYVTEEEGKNLPVVPVLSVVEVATYENLSLFKICNKYHKYYIFLIKKKTYNQQPNLS